jgi:dihydrofolate reductase
MRNVVFQMMTTLNGRVDDPDAWVTGVSDDHYTDIDTRYATYDTVLVGRVTYEEMYAYWPGAETEEGGTETNRRMAHRMNTYRKVVVSRDGEPGPLAWTNASLARVAGDEDLVALVAGLKAQPGGDVHLAGGASLAQTMARLGLIDAYHIYVYPVLSPGKAWFDQVADPRGLILTGATTFEDGVVGLSYAPGTEGQPVVAHRESFTEFLT